MFLGYIISAVSVMGSMKTVATAVLIVPLLALTVPITDTLLAIVRRKSSGVPIFSPDKNHLHHRLLAKGLNQKQVVLVMYALTAFFSCTALIVIHLSLWIRHRDRSHRPHTLRPLGKKTRRHAGDRPIALPDGTEEKERQGLVTGS